MTKQEAINKIVQMRAEGASFTDIALAVGLSETQVTGLWRRNHAAAPPAATVESDPEHEPTIDELSRAVRAGQDRRHQDRLFKELLLERSITDRIVDAVVGALPRLPYREIATLDPPRVHDGSQQIGFLALSDLHIGAVADVEETGGFGEYSYEVFRRRLDNLRDAVRSITMRERHFSPITHLVVASLGDVIENDEIFPAQAQMVDLDLADQFLAAVDDLAVFLVQLLDTYDTIFVPTVTGNHGRIGRKGQRKRHINWDYLVGHMLKAKLERYADRITIEVPKAPFMVIDVLGYKFLLRHGDGIKSWAGIPYYGISRSVGRWTAIQATTGDRFDYMVMGHFHQPASIPFTAGEVLINGCFPGTTEFSIEVMESLARPMQLFGFVHERYGLAARFPIFLDRTTDLSAFPTDQSGS